MEEIRVENWEAFLAKMQRLEEYRDHLTTQSRAAVSEVFYRGQTKSSWELTTTLERVIKEIRCTEYNDIIWGIKAQIESFTNRHWDLANPRTQTASHHTPTIPAPTIPESWHPEPFFSYMLHLRHHGFPSPLLDWTTSPYIAAYFAFKDARDPKESVAIYAYLSDIGEGKGGWTAEQQIHSLSPNVETHPRHFLQKSRYTYCIRVRAKDHIQIYSHHERAFARNDEDQDLLWKFSIPATERRKVLKYLDRFNISSYSLFGSEESLMETLAIHEFDIS